MVRQSKAEAEQTIDLTVEEVRLELNRLISQSRQSDVAKPGPRRIDAITLFMLLLAAAGLTSLYRAVDPGLLDDALSAAAVGAAAIGIAVRTIALRRLQFAHIDSSSVTIEVAPSEQSRARLRTRMEGIIADLKTVGKAVDSGRISSKELDHIGGRILLERVADQASAQLDAKECLEQTKRLLDAWADFNEILNKH